jgi:CspA family cold shock protein
MAKGIVAWFSNTKSYGFIERTPKDGPDVFCHYKDILMDGYKTLSQGDHVEFEPAERDGRTVATNVRVAEKAVDHGR